MLSKRVSQSKKVNRLSLKAQIIWTWTIPFLDDYGCYTGDPEDIKTEVLPKNKKISQKDIECALKEMAEIDLIIWYNVKNGYLVQQYQDFDRFQTFKGDRERKSDYPRYEPENKDMVPVGNQRNPKPSLKLIKANLTKDKISKEKQNKDVVFPENLNTEKFIQVWAEWTRYRIASRHKLTPITIEKQLELLAKFSETEAIIAINKSIQNGWQGLFPDHNGTGRKETTKEQIDRMIAEGQIPEDY